MTKTLTKDGRPSPARRSASVKTPRASWETPARLGEILARRSVVDAVFEDILAHDTVLPDAMPPRVRDEIAFILHTWEWSESSLLLDVLSERYGRVFLVAKGAKRPSSQMRGLLVPFCPLRLSWSGRKEAKTLSAVQWLGTMTPLGGQAMMSGFYVNELVLKLTEREERHPGLFNAYVRVVRDLAGGDNDNLGPALRRFESQLLTLCGWAPTVIERAGCDEYCVRDGAVYGVAADVPEAVSGRHYSAAVIDVLMRRDFADRRYRGEVRDLLRDLIDQQLQSRSLHSRRVLADLNRLSGKTRSETVIAESAQLSNEENTHEFYQ